MKQFFYFLSVIAFSFSLTACSGDACEDVNCVNGECIDGTCECETGWTGENCDEEKTPRSITINKVTITNFPATDNGKPWDDEYDDSRGDISIKIYDLTQNYFTATDIINQTKTDAEKGEQVEIEMFVKINDMENKINFDVVDYDVSEDFSVEWEFIGSISTTMEGLYDNFPSTIELSSGSGAIKLELDVSYQF